GAAGGRGQAFCQRQERQRGHVGHDSHAAARRDERCRAAADRCTDPVARVSERSLSGPEITPVRGRLEAKVAVVTGAARGIGRAIASRFAEEGASVVLADIDGDAAEQTSAKLREGGKSILAVQADVSSRESVDAMIDASVREFGAIDILVNNAGIIVFGSLMDCRPGDWDRMMAVDLTGAFHCTQAAGRQ